MKVLVTGANGFLGTGIVKALCDKEIEVVAACFPNADGVDERAKIVCGDIFSIEDPFSFFGSPDIVLHLAWRNGFLHDDYSHVEDLPKHYLFLKKMAFSGCKQIAVMGTMHEIGFFEGSINETTPTNPANLYGVCKNALRRMTEELCEKTGAVYQWLRGFYIVANTEKGNSIFSKIVREEKNGRKTFPFTSGLNQYDFIDYSEFCRQVVLAVSQNKINGIINICSGRPERLSDRVERFIRENGFKIKLDYGKYPDRTYDSKAVWGDDKKIRQILGNGEK